MYCLASEDSHGEEKKTAKNSCLKRFDWDDAYIEHIANIMLCTDRAEVESAGRCGDALAVPCRARYRLPPDFCRISTNKK